MQATSHWTLLAVSGVNVEALARPSVADKSVYNEMVDVSVLLKLPHSISSRTRGCRRDSTACLVASPSMTSVQ